MRLKLVGGKVLTMAPGAGGATAVAIDGDRIAAVGSDHAILGHGSAPAEVMDLKGRTVLPGFIDSHVHAFATGMMSTAVDLSDATSVSDVCRALSLRVRKSTQELPAGAWIYGLGCSPWALAEKRYPTCEELATLELQRPVFICSSTFHSSATDRLGLERLGRAAVTPAAGPAAPRDEPGWFLDDASHFAAARAAFGALADEEIAALYRLVADLAARKGVTTLHCLEGQFVEGDRDVGVLHSLTGSLPVNVVLMYQTMEVERALRLGLPRIGGCLTVDGACFERTACFYEPYLDCPSTRGHLNYPEEVIRDFVEDAHVAGLQIGMHAIGDRAIDVLVGAYASAMERHPRPDPRHRIEHFQAPTSWAVGKARELGLALAMQPIFSYLWDRPEADHYQTSFGAARAECMESFAALIAGGLVIAGGSDSPVTRIDPLLGIHSAVNNPRVSRRTTVAQALRMFTVNGAWLAHQERERGTIETGKCADLVVLEADPHEETMAIADIPVAMTIAGGRITFADAASW